MGPPHFLLAEREGYYWPFHNLIFYRRRYKVERTFSWLGNNRRLVVRWERDVEHRIARLLLSSRKPV